MALAGAAGIGLVLIALIGGIAGYIDNYYTESVAQYVANDLRQKVYHHLQRLSLTFYDTHQIGNILSTMTADIATIQSFASSALLSILIDALTIVGMLGLMFYMNWDFALIAVAVTPLLLFFVARFKRAVKKATHEVRTQQSPHGYRITTGTGICSAVKHLTGRIWKKNIWKSKHEHRAGFPKCKEVKSLLSPL
jgi:subfamily B ATP-binding cassette protein MsbA